MSMFTKKIASELVSTLLFGVAMLDMVFLHVSAVPIIKIKKNRNNRNKKIVGKMKVCKCPANGSRKKRVRGIHNFRDLAKCLLSTDCNEVENFHTRLERCSSVIRVYECTDGSSEYRKRCESLYKRYLNLIDECKFLSSKQKYDLKLKINSAFFYSFNNSNFEDELKNLRKKMREIIEEFSLCNIDIDDDNKEKNIERFSSCNIDDDNIDDLIKKFSNLSV